MNEDAGATAELERADGGFVSPLSAFLDALGSAAFALDGEGVLVAVNAAAEVLLGYGGGELLGLRAEALVPASARGAHPLLGRGEEGLPARQPLGAGGSLPFLRKDGGELRAQLGLGVMRVGPSNVVVAQLLDCAAGLFEEALLRTLVESLGPVFWLSEGTFDRILYVSQAYEAIWGRPTAGLLESPSDWLVSIHPDDRERVFNAACLKQRRGDYDEEYRIVRPDGSVRWIRDRAVPVMAPDGVTLRMAGVAEDITDRRTHTGE